jgi:ring-1,2-phenylacetyl-CoA epoxidase subunit PaaC
VTAGTADLPALDEAARTALAELLLSIADDEFVIGFWDSEWTGIAPMLEEDVATSSISQDEIGHANALYGLLAELTGSDPDRIAFGRAADDYRHAALLNHPRTDWGFTVARRYLYETADAVRLEALTRSTFAPLAGLAAKMRREERYHLMHLDAWLRRLADAGGEARSHLATALERLWADAMTIYTPLAGEEVLVRSGILPEPMLALRDRWLEHVLPTILGLGLPGPSASVRQSAPARDGRTRRTDDFRWLHGQFTMVAASDPEAEW